MRLKLLPEKTHIPFINARRVTFVLSTLLIVASMALFFTKGLNLGIDFRGGIMIEAGFEEPAELAPIRRTLGGMNLGDVAVQHFGDPSDVLIRIERQEDADVQNEVVQQVQSTLEREIDPNISWRRVDIVGPVVSGELIRDGILAVVLAVIAVLIYIWFRFEWQFGLGAVIALVHDVLLTIGLFSLTGLDFNLSIIAAVLTIVGYSLNDTVVVYDRIRENLRKYKRMPMVDLLNMSLNETLSRTVMTSVSTLMALISLFVWGGEVLRGFTAAMIWGVVVGTYSSVFIAAPVLIWMKLQRRAISGEETPAGAKAAEESA